MKNFTLIIIMLFALTVFSCQDEGQAIVQDTSNNFTKSSPIASLISRVSQYETTSDNVLDGTSNCSIKLPAMVTVNGQYVYVFDSSYYQDVQDIKNQSSTDDDKVHFNYPITIIYPNYHEHSLNSETQFNNMMESYGDDSPYRKVSCLHFNFPISVNLYNTNNQVASTVLVQSDMQFCDFIYNLNDSQIVGIVFPITLTDSNSATVTINSKAELEDAINNAASTCTTGPAPSSLNDILTSGTWHVSYCYSGKYENTPYDGYNFTFNVGGECIAVKNSTTINGDWDADNGMPQRLSLHFDGSMLDALETNWDVLERTSTSVRLKKSSGGGKNGPGPGSESTYLTFTKNQ